MFGCGRNSFYIRTLTRSELKPGPVFPALMLDESVLHVDLDGEVALPQPTVSRFDIEANDFTALFEFI